MTRSIQKLLRDKVSESEKGVLFESLVLHELNAYISYYGVGGDLFYWRTPDGVEIDFIWKRADKIVAIEVKSSNRWKDEYNSGLKAFLSSSIKPHACYGIYTGNDVLKKEFGMVLPWKEFLQRLYAGEIIS